MERVKTITIIILILGLLLSLGYIFYYQKNLEPPEETKITLYDTLTIHDTIIKLKTKIQYITKDSIEYIYKTDSITDTVFVEVPIEHKIYHDTIRNDSSFNDITIRYSGFHSTIDEVNIISTYTRKVEVQKLKLRKWHLAVTAGYYTGYDLTDKKIYSGPGAGLSISYDLW